MMEHAHMNIYISTNPCNFLIFHHLYPCSPIESYKITPNIQTFLLIQRWCLYLWVDQIKHLSFSGPTRRWTWV